MNAPARRARMARGRRAERIAERYLTKQGGRLLVRNYRMAGGEIDLVMLHRRMLVAIEVRYRADTRLLEPVSTVTRPKCRRLMRTLQHFALRHAWTRDLPMRFDLVGIAGDLDHPVIHWIPAAFTLDDLE